MLFGEFLCHHFHDNTCFTLLFNYIIQGHIFQTLTLRVLLHVGPEKAQEFLPPAALPMTENSFFWHLCFKLQVVSIPIKWL